MSFRGFAPRLGIVLGSGLGAVAAALEDPVEILYTELPDFPQPGVAGHAGSLALGGLNGLPVAVFQGRRHVYGRCVRPGRTRFSSPTPPVRCAARLVPAR